MNDFFVALWGENWPTHLIIVFLFVFLLNLIGSTIKRWPPWRAFWLARYFSAEALYSMQCLIYLAKRNTTYRKGTDGHAPVSRDKPKRIGRDSD